MARQTIVAEFHDSGAAHRAFAELLQSGVQANDISLIAGDRSDSFGAQRDFGILEDETEHHCADIRRGITLLAVRADDRLSARVRQIIGEYAPIGIEEAAMHSGRSVTMSGAPADHGASPGGLPEAERRSDWLVREEADLAADVDPENDRR